ncbi:MAG TPA: ABC transporter permease [Longimicrobiales bacterium]|nr:ABC transporter permease [Longimicrobiales bacterium]
MSTPFKDLVHAARGLRKAPAFTLAAALTIALGIGASTAIFSVVNAVLLRPLPYKDPDRLVIITSDMRNRNVPDFPFPPGDVKDLREDATLLEGLAAVVTGRQAVSGDDGEPEQVQAAGVTPNFFSLLGARVALGRNFVESDATPQPAPPGPPPGPLAGPPANALPLMAVLSHGFWQRRYGGDPGVIGKSIDLGGARAQVVGVLQPGFEVLFPPRLNIERTPDVYTALRIDYENGSRINVFLRLIGKLKPGVSVARAEGQMEGIAADLRHRFPIKEAAGVHFRVEPMHAELVADVRPAILALMGAVVFVLLIACANVANLLLVRAGGRGRELAVRAALGGTRRHLVRPVLAESLLVAGAGAALGVLLARFGIQVLVRLGPASLPRLDAVTIDRAVLAFAVLAGLCAAILFGLVPALRASRPDLMDALRSSGRTAALGGGRLARSAVVTAEVALSFVLLVGCGLMFRSFVALQRTDPGFEPAGVLTFVVQNFRGRTPDARAADMRQLAERLRALPGVRGVTAATPLPLDGGLANGRWGTEEALADPSKFQQATSHTVLPGYFETMRTRLLAGRTFTEADNTPDAKLVIIDRVLAAKAFPNQSAVGKRLLVRIRSNEAEWLEVVGVVEHERHESLAAEGREAMFFTDGFLGHGFAGRWAVRVAGDPARLAPPVRAAVKELNPLLAVAEMEPYQALVDRAQAPTRFALVMIAIFAAIAALLASVGLYGVLSTAVRQRTAEIGVRMAFGAAKGSIFQLVVTQGLKLSGIGILLGLAAALALTRVMRSMLVGVAPTDPLTFAAIAGLFVLIAAVASWLPARRAAELDPTVALRGE